MRKLYKMKEEYSLQDWYNGDGVFELEFRHTDRYIQHFGTDCTWINFRTKEIVNIWDNCMREISNEELTKLVRDYNLEQLGI